jgi:prefoldin subunit 1
LNGCTGDLTQVLGEVEQKYAQTQAELQSVKAQIAAKTREIKLIDVTETQLKEQVPDPDTRVWRGVGKMFLSMDFGSYMQSLEKDKKDSQEQTAALKKKEQYLETTHKNLTTAITEIMSKGR